jgi:hypothetical protein
MNHDGNIYVYSRIYDWLEFFWYILVLKLFCLWGLLFGFGTLGVWGVGYVVYVIKL